MGYVIGQYFHQDTSYKKQEILPMCYEISQNKDKKVYSKYAKINQSLREANWTTLRNKEGTADYALKYALRQYKATNGENAEMVDYLIKILEKKIPEIQLMIPELIWLLCKYFPSDHKYIKMFLPNAKAYRDYILLEGGRDLDPRVENAYADYYPSRVRYMMWEDMAELILSKNEMFEGVLKLLESDEVLGDCYSLIPKTSASTYSALFRTAFKMSKDPDKQKLLPLMSTKNKTIAEAILAPLI